MSEVAVWGVIVGRRSHRQKKRKENLTLGSPFLSSHDILRYFNTRFYQVTYSDLLRRTPKYSGDLLLILFK